MGWKCPHNCSTLFYIDRVRLSVIPVTVTPSCPTESKVVQPGQRDERGRWSPPAPPSRPPRLPRPSSRRQQSPWGRPCWWQQSPCWWWRSMIRVWHFGFETFLFQKVCQFLKGLGFGNFGLGKKSLGYGFGIIGPKGKQNGKKKTKTKDNCLFYWHFLVPLHPQKNFQKTLNPPRPPLPPASAPWRPWCFCKTKDAKIAKKKQLLKKCHFTWKI